MVHDSHSCSQHCLVLEQTSGSWASAWMKRATVLVIGGPLVVGSRSWSHTHALASRRPSPGQTCVSQRNHVLDGGAHWRHLANTIERSVSDGDAAYVKWLWPLVERSVDLTAHAEKHEDKRVGLRVLAGLCSASCSSCKRDTARICCWVPRRR